MHWFSTWTVPHSQAYSIIKRCIMELDSDADDHTTMWHQSGIKDSSIEKYRKTMHYESDIGHRKPSIPHEQAAREHEAHARAIRARQR